MDVWMSTQTGKYKRNSHKRATVGKKAYMHKDPGTQEQYLEAYESTLGGKSKLTERKYIITSLVFPRASQFINHFPRLEAIHFSQ